MKRNSVNKAYLVLYLCLVVAASALILIRWAAHLAPETKLLPDFIMLHATNFSISMLLMLFIGFIALVCGGKMRSVLIAGLVIIAANFICELFLTFLNTTDIIDAVAGAIGVAIALIFLHFLNKNGLVDKGG